MGLLDHREVAGRDGLENERWRALEVHNTLVEPIKDKMSAAERKGRKIKLAELPRIFR